MENNSSLLKELHVSYRHVSHPELMETEPGWTRFQYKILFRPKNIDATGCIDVLNTGEQAKSRFLDLLRHWNRTPEWIYYVN